MVDEKRNGMIEYDASHETNRLLLDTLSRKGGAVSGIELSKQLGISRTAVWKHIHTLIDYGYPIRAGAKGYTLLGPGDHLFPWEFTELGAAMRYYDTLGSTMDAARGAAAEGARHKTVLLAEAQSNGRGRSNRMWSSEKGGLYSTIILRPDIPLSQCSIINFAAAVSLCSALERYYGIRAGVKWPNDVIIEGKKIAGILIEASGSPLATDYVNVGIGINVNNRIESAPLAAVSLRSIVGRQLSRKEFFIRFFKELDYHLNETGDEILSLWKSYAVGLNKRVRIRNRQEPIEGRAIDVRRDGALLVRTDDGTLKSVYTGDIDIVGERQ